MKKSICLLMMGVVLAACAATTPEMTGFTYKPVATSHITLAAWQRDFKPYQPVRIYIDGNAYTDGFFGTKRPRMYAPVGMQLALKDKKMAVAYLARPCYFMEHPVCTPIAWERGKYAPELIDEMTEAILSWQKKYHFSYIELVGYDGGAAIAMSLAARLKNVNVGRIITVAGILDTQKDAQFHDEDILPDSINPVKDMYALARIPQIHYVGGKDKTVPESFTVNFVKTMNAMKPVSVQVRRLPNADHENWANFTLDY